MSSLTVSKGLNHFSRASDDFPLIVNYIGKLNLNKPFLTHNTDGRSDFYLLYVTNGKLTVILNDVPSTMNAGDFIIFPPQYKYRYELTHGTLSYFFVHFTGSHVTEYLEALKISENPKVRHAHYGEELSQSFSSFFIEYESDGMLRDASLSIELSRILMLLAKEFHVGNGARSLSESLAYINENYTKQINIPTLAALEGLSVSRYNYLFKECVGVSPLRYITNLRMRQAQILLDSTNLPIKQIAEMVGYEDNHFFSKHFKAYIGVSPIFYRKNGK